MGEIRRKDFESGEDTLNLNLRSYIRRESDSADVTPALTVISGPELGLTYKITREQTEVIVGRFAKVDFQLKDPSVSRTHVRFLINRKGEKVEVWVEDLGSTNGTLVNGVEVKKALLESRDKIQIGRVVLRYDLLDPEEVKFHSIIFRKAKAADIDPLTTLYSRRFCEEVLPEVITECERENEPLSFIMIDLDHFKKVNDDAGHLVGDEVLRKTAQLILSQIREDDIAIRYGGEEFLIVLPGKNLELAKRVAERLRNVVEEADFTSIFPELKITISCGVTEHKKYNLLNTTINSADQALYLAKQRGRNRVEIK